MQPVYVAHYHEIALKGRNRPDFLRKLQENICAVTGLGKNAVKVVSGRLIVRPPLNLPLKKGEKIVGALGRVFGISSFSPAVFVPGTYLDIEHAVAQIVASPISGKSSIVRTMELLPEFETFAIDATRGDKKFPMTSKDLEVKLGDFVREKFKKKVDLKNPDATFYVEIFPDPKGQFFVGEGLSFGGALVYTEKIPGPGGLPAGIAAKVAVLLSGGIDSPLAAYRIMKRGAPMLAVHFHSYPFASRASIDKVKEVSRVLAQYSGGGSIKLYTVPLAEAQKQVVQKCNERYRVLLYRRLMWRIAAEIAKREGAQALVSGESLGQVASQTIENMAAVEAALHYRHPEQSEGSRAMQDSWDSSALPRNDKSWLPIFRPLISFDKQEIINEAQRIGTFEISIQPHEDCCSLFMPKKVVTKARIEDLDREERKLDVEKLIEEAINQTQLEVAAAL